MFWREILKYDTTVDYTGEAVASGDAPWGFEYALTSTENTTLDALDTTKKHYGYTRYSSYSSSTTKINDIIVFDPVTTEGAMVIGKDSDLDQRVDGQALAALANREAEEGQDGCPGNAAECSVRPDADLTCTYKKRQAVAAFSTKTLDDFEKALGSYADEETATDSDYTWYLRNSVENAYGTNATVSLADSFLTIEGSGSQHYLYADGTVNSSLLLSWGSLGIDTEYTSQTYTIGAYFYFEQYNTTTLFSTGDWTLNYAANSFQLVNNKTGEAYRTGYDSGSLNTWTLVFMKFCMDGSTPTVTAGGKTLSFSIKLAAQGTDSTTGSGIYIGNTPNGTYQGAFRVKDITVYREAGSTAHTSACYAADGTLDCQEPHHTGGHYDTDNTTCWMSCLEYYTSTLGKEKGEEKSRELHNALGSTVTTPNGTIGKADFILLDNYFDIYFPTSGNFYESSAHAIGTLSSTTGIGYYNGMSSAEWTREKLVQFPSPVLYYRASTGKWEEYAANEWISLDVKIEDAATQERYKKVLEGFGYSITNVNIGTGIEYYNFYTQLKGGEVSMGTVKFAAEAINNQTVPAVETYGKEFYEIALDPALAYLKDTDANLDCPAADSSSTNRFTHYHSAYRTQYLDVVGRIGNLIVEDTDDLRFANLFKKSTLLDDDDTNDGWYLDGIAGTVDPSKQNNYMVWEGLVDLRGLKVSAENGYYNTYGTLPWTVVSSDYDTADGLLNTPVSGDKNNIASLAGEPLRLGYDILWDIETIGNYELGKLAVKPYYYILDTETSTLIPADLYMEDGTDTKALNLFAALDGSDTSLLDSITDYPVYLNWENEQTRRNYTGVEKATTEHVRDFIGYYVYGSDGQALSYTTTVKRELDDGTYDTYTIDRPYVRHASIPYGTYYSLGNYQLLVAGERARTFIGSSVTTALGKDINGSNNVELDSCSDSALYGVKGQRWHLKLGTPSSAKFTAYVDRDGDGVAEHVSPDTYVTYSDGTIGTAGDEYSDSDRYVILLTADITAIGETYSLHYTQGTKNGTIEVNGKKFTFTDLEHGGIPTLIAVYSTTSSSLDDVDTMQSH
jgi:hypothetical protein